MWREVILRGSIEKWKDSFPQIPEVCAKCKLGLLGFAECLFLGVVPEEHRGEFSLLPVKLPENSISCLRTWALACLHGTHISDLFCFGGVVVVWVDTWATIFFSDWQFGMRYPAVPGISQGLQGATQILFGPHGVGD